MLSKEYLIAIASNCGAKYVETIKRIIKRNNVKKVIYVG